jgi:hypothetical protein
MCGGGANGFFIVMLTLAWWLDTGDKAEDFSKALEDVTWVLTQMIATLQTRKRVHDLEDNNGDENSAQGHAKRRQVSLVVTYDSADIGLGKRASNSWLHYCILMFMYTHC